MHGAEIDAKTNYTGIGIFVDFDEIMNDLTQGLNHSTPLHFAARNGHLEIVELLLQHGANFTATNVYYDNDLKHTPVDLAAENGHFDVVDCLLYTEYTSDPTAKYPLNPLTIAAGLGKLELMDLMVKNGYDVNAESWVTPLHVAAVFQNFKLAKFLVQNKANLNARAGKFFAYGNSTPLHVVARNGNFEIAELLLQNEADVNGKDFYQKTPLHYAVINGHPKLVEVLLKHGARKDLEDYSGNTPLDLAKDFSYKENGVENYQKIVALLKTD